MVSEMDFEQLYNVTILETTLPGEPISRIIKAMQSKRWLIQPKLTPQADENLVAFPPILRQLLFNRGYATDASARAFLKAEANFDTNPFQIKNMDAAIERIRFALDHQQAIAIYGDYDVDGVTATALLLQTLQGSTPMCAATFRIDSTKAMDLTMMHSII